MRLPSPRYGSRAAWTSAVEAGAVPVAGHQGALGRIERLKAASESREELVDRGRPVAGSLGQDLNHGEQVLHAVRQLRRQHPLALLTELAIVDVGRGPAPGGDAARRHRGSARRASGTSGTRRRAAGCAPRSRIRSPRRSARVHCAMQRSRSSGWSTSSGHCRAFCSGVIPQKSKPAVTGEGDGAVRIGHPDDVGDGIGQGAEARVARAQRRLGAFALGDVPGDLGGADDLAASSRIGETVRATSIRLPSLRRRTVS